MKKILLLFLLSFFLVDAWAQVGTDSAAYQAQRAKINGMLAVRKQKFGQYDQSLSQHTGIFGLQTKKDIRHSNDILMDIVKTDNDIFVQTKILLDYRTFEQNQAQTHAVEVDSNATGYMATINKLRAENDKLKHDAEVCEGQQKKASTRALAIVIALIVALLFLLRAKYVKKD
ncbi:hypothetical protein HDF19_16720 [Mucilaginibacter sp. E4BP6]|uniref:hypothetical protein n=1 Tax=Mucilaginibacter sp. E4BP6 TaxID=2723089 RepID=UPI0015CD6950|nr:hypothetical protein [Mucilaginibacter sp. E4BP6]NYE66467.1 hypothetical protein [Mucilaginibacter sp. E4BP6]